MRLTLWKHLFDHTIENWMAWGIEFCSRRAGKLSIFGWVGACRIGRSASSSSNCTTVLSNFRPVFDQPSWARSHLDSSSAYRRNNCHRWKWTTPGQLFLLRMFLRYWGLSFYLCATSSPWVPRELNKLNVTEKPLDTTVLPFVFGIHEIFRVADNVNHFQMTFGIE